MKRCPECRRDYYDDSLLYCLDDGSALLDGPDGQRTALLHDAAHSDESPTRLHVSELRGASSDKSAPVGIKGQLRTRLLFATVAAGLLIAVAFFAYRYGSSPQQIDSIAVLPFENQSGNSELDYLADGMSETLLNSLGEVPGLSVKARSSVIRYTSTSTDPATLGRELGVQVVLKGRVMQRGETLTVFLELVEARTRNRIWGAQYDRKQAEIVALQSQMARDVSGRIRSQLSGEEKRLVVKTDTANPDAYRLYLQGRYIWNKRRIDSMGEAISLFQQTIDLDPNYARAYAGLADAVAQPNDLIPHERRAEMARSAAMKALAIDPNLAEAHTALAHVLSRYDANFVEAERMLLHSLNLDPRWSDSYQRLAEIYTYTRRHDEAIAITKRGLEGEPFSQPLNTTLIGTYVYARRYDEAVEHGKRTLELDPQHRPAHALMTLAYTMKKMYPEAVYHRIKTHEITNQPALANAIRVGFERNGWEGVLRAELERFASPTRSYDRLPHYHEAHFRAAVGEREAAFASLERSIADREMPALVYLAVDPRFDPIRDDPRFEEILRRLGLK